MNAELLEVSVMHCDDQINKEGNKGRKFEKAFFLAVLVLVD